jgi:hypothetical protein
MERAMQMMHGISIGEFERAGEESERSEESLALWLVACQKAEMSDDDWELLRLEARFLLDMDQLD